MSLRKSTDWRWDPGHGWVTGNQVRGHNHPGFGDLQAAGSVTCPPYLSRGLALISSSAVAHGFGRDSESEALKSRLELQGFGWGPVTELWKEIRISLSFSIDHCWGSQAWTPLFAPEKEEEGECRAGSSGLGCSV